MLELTGVVGTLGWTEEEEAGMLQEPARGATCRFGMQGGQDL